jgi:fengycin family lipopeptide synthetase D
VSYNSLLFARERMQEFLAQLAFLTEAVIAQGVDAAVDSISLLTPFAKAVVPDPAAPLSAEFFGSIQSHLEKRATLHPDRALVYENNGAVSYSYQQVNELANRVANFLLSAASIKPEDVVVIFAHRSAPLVVAIMGVLK